MSNVMQEAQVEIVINPRIASAVMPRGPVPFLSRQQILEATERCFAEGGYDGTTIRAITGRLGCSSGSIYRYFQDKRELLLACGDRALNPVLARLEAGATMEQSMADYESAAKANSQLYRLLFWLTEGGVPQVVHRIIARWSGLLGQWAEAERRWTLLHGLLMLGREESVVSRLASSFVELEVQPAQPAPPAEHTPVSQAEDMTLL